MMMKKLKQKFAFLAACAVLLNTGNIPIQADASQLFLVRDETTNAMELIEEEEFIKYPFNYSTSWLEYHKGEHGELFYSFYHQWYGVYYVITDGADLPDDFLHPSYRDPEDDWIRWKEINPNEIEKHNLENSYYDNPFPDLKATERVFQIEYNISSISKKKWTALTKKLTQYDHIMDCFEIWDNTYGSSVWDGKFSLIITTEAAETYDYQLLYDKFLLSEADLTEEEKISLSDLAVIYDDWKTKYDSWKASVNLETMTHAEIEASRKAARLLSDYDITRKAYETADRIIQNHPDIYEVIQPKMIFSDWGKNSYIESLQVVNVWEHVGDLDGDDKISAGDAALLLTAVAESGTGIESLNEIQAAYADINLDGKSDATDASLLLEYIAQLGTGQADDLQEFLKQK